MSVLAGKQRQPECRAMAQKNYQRPPFHPYGYAATGDDDMAFIRIPKNGSSSFVKSFSLGNWTHVSALRQHTIYCALRDPVGRFLSSIVETVMRARLYQDGRFFGDIVIDPAIYFEMQRLLCGEQYAGLLDYMIDVIDSHGPLDAHHERQVRFLEDFTPRLKDIAFFDVAQADGVIQGLLVHRPGVQVDANRLRDGKRMVVQGRGFVGVVQSLQTLVRERFFTDRLSPRHLIMPLLPGRRQPRFRSAEFNARMVAFGEAIRLAATPERRARIAALYAEDQDIYARVAGKPGFTQLTALP